MALRCVICQTPPHYTCTDHIAGGLAVFGGFTLYDVQKVLHHARMSERGLMRRDAVNESVRLELDFINIFVRMVQILAMQQGRRK